jgi:malonyl-CoA O-methyltransferase
MISVKKKIANRFNTASNSYDSVAQIQKYCAEFLIKKLLEIESSFDPQTILDLGTGTGYVPEFLMQYYPKSSYTLNDIAPKMIKMVKNKFAKHSNFEFCIGDMENIDFKDHELIISNLALQWASDLTGTIQKLYKKSKVLAFSCLLDGTFYEWNDVLKSYGLTSASIKYPKLEDLILFCKKLGADQFCFELKDLQLRFSNACLFMQYLKKLGAGASNINIPISALKSLIADHNNELLVTYKVFFGIMR